MCSTFESNSWQFNPVAGALVVECGFEAHHGRVPLHVQVFEEIQAVSVVAQTSLPPTLDPDRRIKVAELLMRVNSQLTLGAFELRWEEGETLFRLSNLIPPKQHDSALITALVEIAVVECDRLLPVLHQLQEMEISALPSLDVARLLADNPVPEVDPPPAAVNGQASAPASGSEPSRS